MSLSRTKKLFLLVATLLSLTPALAYAWPADSQWLELAKGGAPIQDLEADANGGVNVVPNDGSNPAAYIYNDGSYLYYRIRLDADPTQGGNGVFAQFGWGFEIDTDQNADDYEWLIMCDGISQPEVISLRENTDKTGIGDPSDKAEYVAAEYPLVGNHRLSQIQPGDRDYTAINGDPDYYLDYRLPYGVFKSVTGITDDTLIRYFVGSSRSTNNLTDNGADLVGGSDLYEMGSDYTSPFGTPPPAGSFTDGTVRFVDSLDGFNDVNLVSGGDTIHIRVDDADQTLAVNPAQTIRVELTAPSGDSLVVILTATGVSGKFTGSVPTQEVTRTQDIDAGDSVLQVMPSGSAPTDQEVISVIYIDSIDASGNQQVPRTDTITFTTSATDLSVAKTVDTTVAQQNDPVRFTVTIENKGPNDASGVVVTDLLPAGLSYTGSSASVGSYTSGTGIWNIGALVAYSSATLTVDAQVSAASGSISNVVSLTALNETDGYAGNNIASATLYVGGTDIRVTKSVDNDYPAEGELIVFTVRALNLGPNGATGITVNDLLPAGLNYDAATGYTATQGSYDGTTGVWSLGDLASGVGAVLTIPAKPQIGTANTILTNTASLGSLNEPETNGANDAASVDIKVNFHDLELTKQVGVGPSYNPLVNIAAPNENGQIRYTLTLTNHGPNDASGIEISDLLPVGVTYTAATASAGSYDSATGLWSIGALAAGDSETLEIDATVDSGTAGQTIVNTASISASDYLDDNSANDSDSATLKVDGTDLMLVKTVDKPAPSPGDPVTYSITITNNGPNPASGVKVSDIPPAGVSFNGSSVTAGSYDDSGGQPSYVWDIGNLAVAASETLTITASVDSGTSGQTISNVAMITETDQEDPDSLNNVASATISVDGTDLGISKTVDDPTANENQNVTYTIVVTNNGPTDASGVQVTDLLPPEVSYQSAVAPAGDSYDAATGLWNIGNLSASAGSNTATLQIVVQVKNGTSGLIISNTASISALDQGDQNTANDFASVDIAVAGTDLSLTKKVNGLDSDTPSVGAAVTYTISVSNSGVNGATGIEIEDILPAGVTYISDTPSQGSYSAGTWLVGGLAAGASASLDILAGVDGPAGTTVTNTARIIGFDQTDDNPVNDSDSADITPEAKPVLTILKSASGATAKPGDVITYTVTVLNAGADVGTNVVLTDSMSPYTAWQLDYNNDGAPDEPFSFTPGSSGLTLGAPDYSRDDGGTWGQTPASGGGGMAAGFDGSITNWTLPMTGTMTAGGSFTLRYRAMVK